MFQEILSNFITTSKFVLICMLFHIIMYEHIYKASTGPVSLIVRNYIKVVLIVKENTYSMPCWFIKIKNIEIIISCVILKYCQIAFNSIKAINNSPKAIKIPQKSLGLSFHRKGSKCSEVALCRKELECQKKGKLLCFLIKYSLGFKVK